MNLDPSCKRRTDNMDEFTDGVQRGDIAKVSDHIGWLENNPNSPGYVYGVRYAVDNNDPQMLKYLLSAVDRYNHVFDIDTINASIMNSEPWFFKTLVGDEGEGLKQKVPPHKHPLVVAARVGNRMVAKYIVDWIRKGDNSKFLENPNAVKDLALKMAARGGHVAIANLLITDQDHAHQVIAGLIVNGHVDKVKRFAASDRVDFSANKFELLKLCAPYPSVLNYVMRHPSVVRFKDNMPTEYSQIAMVAAEDHYHDTVDLVERSFKKRLTLHASAKVKHTGCSTKDAVAETYSGLYNKHQSHLNHSSLKNFSF